MDNNLVGNIDFSQIVERKLKFLLDNEIDPWNGDDSDLGKRDALERMLEDSRVLSEKQFEDKYTTELAELKTRFEIKEYSAEDGDDYYESYNNTLVEILRLINTVHLYDLSD